MRTQVYNTVKRRHLGWLLCVVLLLPLAQLAANWHLLSHVKAVTVAVDGDPQGLHDDHCDLCFTAEALVGGAPLAAAIQQPPVVAPRLTPVARLPEILLSALILAYNSRAPPVSQR